MSIDLRLFKRDYESAAKAHEADRLRRQAQAMTLEFSQPLQQDRRRKRPRRRGAALPMFDPQQLTIPTGDPTK